MKADDAIRLAQEIPDFEVSNIYEVRMYGYDENDQFTGYEKYLNVFLTEEEAIKFIDSYQLIDKPELPTVYVRVEAELKADPGPEASVLMTVRSRVIVY